jgi:radical SAM superfamily enzyme YgiQ (UPF0313 family)
MTYQYASALRVAQICRSLRPYVKIVLGGYHATLMFRDIGDGAGKEAFDFIVRGEGEIIFQNLVNQIQSGEGAFSSIPGLSYRQGGIFYHNGPARLVELDELKLPDRHCRVVDKGSFLGQPFDCVETSRGCGMNCKFCSIRLMYGRAVRNFSLERVITELQHLKTVGKKGIFFVDDNITLNVPRLKQLCELIVKAKLNSLSYTIQASVSGIASDPKLAVCLKKAGFRWVFLGIESGNSTSLESMGKPEVIHNTQTAVQSLQAQGIGVFGGFIIGYPQDTEEDIRSAYRYALDLGVDHPIFQCLTPYPETQVRRELLEGGLITNSQDYSLYNGFTCNIRTEHLTNKQLNHAIFWNGLRLYFNPGYLVKSRFWRYRISLIPALLGNNLRYLSGALGGKIFISRHKW